MNEKKWFILKEHKVQGPFSYEECLSLETQDQKTQTPLLFWGRGLNEWSSFSEWKKEVQQLSENAKAKEKSDWRLIIGENQLGPLRFQEMMEHLQKQRDFSSVLIWHQDFDRWKEVYQLPKVANLLGLATRSFLRLPIQGKVIIETNNSTRDLNLISIGEGGLGVSDISSLNIGEKIRCHIISPYLSSSFRALAEVVYLAGNNQEAGLKFTSLQHEAKSLVIEYIKKFKNVFDS